jgi:hypothetical protein
LRVPKVRFRSLDKGILRHLARGGSTGKAVGGSRDVVALDLLVFLVSVETLIIDKRGELLDEQTVRILQLLGEQTVRVLQFRNSHLGRVLVASDSRLVGNTEHRSSSGYGLHRPSGRVVTTCER